MTLTAVGQRRPIDGAAQSYAAAVRLTATAFGVPAQDPRWHDGRRVEMHFVRARRIALYLSVITGDHSLRRIASVTHLSHEGVRKALRVVEEWRDEETFDQKLMDLEGELSR